MTRRLGWYDLEPGTLLQPVEKAQGLRKGERVRKIGGPIRVVDVRVEPLAALLYDRRNRGDCRREGFPRMRRTEFVGIVHGAQPLRRECAGGADRVHVRGRV